MTAREFAPAERVEVDYAGDTIEWLELKNGEIRKAYVFVAGLGFSHLCSLGGRGHEEPQLARLPSGVCSAFTVVSRM